VSGIKLYEADVAIGRHMRDLSTRLGGGSPTPAPYARSSAFHLRQSGDPFRDELVRTLANGDESLLAMKIELTI
jgi:hypothetical protein